jgi:glycosyltransferase involved in cell wall biosynthesis
MQKNKKITVLHLSKYYPPDNGGIEKITSIIVEEKTKKYIDKMVVCFCKKKSNKKNKKIKRSRPLITIASQPFNIKYIYDAIIESFRADIIHVHAPNPLAFFILLFLNKKIIVHWHSDIIKKNFLNFFFKPVERAVLTKSKKIIIGTKTYLEHSKPLIGLSNKTTIIPYGLPAINKRKFIFNKNIRLIESITANQKIILSVGRLVPYKGFDKIIKIAKYLPKNQRLVIVGKGPLESQLKKINIDKKVIILSNITDNELEYLFKRACIFLLPSIDRRESFGIVLLEALRSGLPIIANKINGSGVNWINQNKKTGLNINFTNTNHIARKIVSLANDEVKISEMKKNCKKRFNELFTSEEMIKKINLLYEEII